MDGICRLPGELIRKIGKYLSTQEIIEASLACHELYNKFISIVYENVDLASYKVDKKMNRVRRTEPRLWPELEDRKPSAIDKALYLRQKKLIVALMGNPELALNIKTLRWSVVFDSAWLIDTTYGTEEYCKKMPKHTVARRISRVDSVDYFNLCNNALWAAFALMKNVTTLDLSFLSNEWTREETPPPPLFKTATSVTLSGIASRFLIMTLLSAIEPANLMYLHLHNLQEFAEYEAMPQTLPLWRKSRTVPWPESRTGNPGPMRTHLFEFFGRWQNLQSLTIDTCSALQTRWETLSDRATYTLIDEDEDKRYGEIGCFIRSISQSLRYLRFEQGRPKGVESPCRLHHDYSSGMKMVGMIGLIGTPKKQQKDDIRFMKYIFPALIESSWPHLRVMEIYGVGGSSLIRRKKNMDYVLIKQPVDHTVLDSLKAAAQRVQILVVEPEATRDFWMAEEGYDCGIPISDPENDQFESSDDDSDLEIWVRGVTAQTG